MSSWIILFIFDIIVCASAPVCVGACQMSLLPSMFALNESSPERPASLSDRSGRGGLAVGRVGVQAFMPSSSVVGSYPLPCCRGYVEQCA